MPMGYYVFNHAQTYGSTSRLKLTEKLVLSVDYDRKADDAVDYEDIEEKYEGPEVQLRSQDEDAISQDQTFYAQAALENATVSLGEDEDYDEEDNYEKEEGHFVEEHEDHQKLAEHPGENAVKVADEGGVLAGSS